MVKPLTFKGEKKSKKRKAPPSTSATVATEDPSSADNPHLTNTSSIDDDDSWVSAEAPTDIIGPVLLLFSSVSPTCIACDQNGKVYASEIENMIEGQPGTAEPHDMRQVWIATRVAGTEKISFKGHHGRLVSPPTAS
jgi:protein FRG1